MKNLKRFLPDDFGLLRSKLAMPLSTENSLRDILWTYFRLDENQKFEFKDYLAIHVFKKVQKFLSACRADILDHGVMDPIIIGCYNPHDSKTIEGLTVGLKLRRLTRDEKKIVDCVRSQIECLKIVYLSIEGECAHVFEGLEANFSATHLSLHRLSENDIEPMIKGGFIDDKTEKIHLSDMREHEKSLVLKAIPNLKGISVDCYCNIIFEYILNSDGSIEDIEVPAYGDDSDAIDLIRSGKIDNVVNLCIRNSHDPDSLYCELAERDLPNLNRLNIYSWNVDVDVSVETAHKVSASTWIENISHLGNGSGIIDVAREYYK